MRVIKPSLAVVVFLLTAPEVVHGQLPADQMSYQGQLISDGAPVPDDTYTIDFSIWDDAAAGNMVWTEQQQVETSGGFFQINLGSVNPLNKEVFGSANDPTKRWLQTQVAGDEPMTPRGELGVSPFSFISTRLNGDIITQPGVAIMGADNGAQILMGSSNGLEAEMLFLAGDEPGRTIQLDANSAGAIIALSDPKTTRTYPDVTISGDATGAGVLLADPRPSPEYATIDIFSGNGTGSISLADPRPSPGFPDLTISGDATGAGILLADPRPSPAFGSLQLRSDANGATVALADPRPSPSVPDLLMLSNQSGSELAFGEVGGLGLIEDEIMILSAVPTGGNISMISPNTQSEIGLGADDLAGTSFLVRNGGAAAQIDPKTDPVAVNLTLAVDDNILANLEATAIGGCIELTEPNSQAQITAKPSGINIYDSEGTMAAVFEPNGVLTTKGNFGSGNTNNGTNTLVSGQGNSATGNFSTVIGGNGNSATGGSAAVVGGVGNSAGFGSAFIGGGQNNNAAGLNSTIGGGNGNSASGANAVIPGGAANIAGGDYSFAAGLRSHADHDGSFVWADATGATLSSEVANQLKARASGGTYIYSNSTSTTGVALTSGSSMWAALSDRNAKRNIRPVDYPQILEKLNQLDISRWSYTEQDESIEHIGPMAQDFYALFGIGEDDKHISTLDPSGVALSAIKALLERVEVLEKRISELESKEK